VPATDYKTWSEYKISAYVPVGATSGKVEVEMNGQKSNGIDVSIVNLWDYLIQTNRFKCWFEHVNVVLQNGSGTNQTAQVGASIRGEPEHTISGNKIHIDFKYETPGDIYTCKIDGTISTDGRTITQLKYEEVYVVYPNTTYGNTTTISFSVENITLYEWDDAQNHFIVHYVPIDDIGNYCFLKNNLTDFKYSYKDDSDPSKNLTLISYDGNEATVSAYFSKE